MEDGVWRTIAGRRVFIREGQSLSDAMRKSGKFTSGQVASKQAIEREEKYKKEDKERDAKAKEQLTEEAKEIMDDMKYLDKDEEGYKEALQEIKERYADLRRKEGNWQSRQSKEIGEALKDIEKEDIIKGIEKVKTQKELLKLRTKGEQITGDPGTDNWDDKFAKKFDAAYQKKEREMVATGKSKTMKEKYLDIPQRERAEAYAQGKNWKDLVKEKEYYKREHLGEPSNYKKGEKIEFNSGYSEKIKGTIVREATAEEKRFVMNSNLKGYVVKDANGNEHVVADTRISKRSTKQLQARLKKRLKK